MHWWQYFSDNSLAQFFNVVKSEYFLVATLVIILLAAIARKTKARWDDKTVAWLKGKLTK